MTLYGKNVVNSSISTKLIVESPASSTSALNVKFDDSILIKTNFNTTETEFYKPVRLEDVEINDGGMESKSLDPKFMAANKLGFELWGPAAGSLNFEK